jgi:RND family efflux transporter MFP subunit
VQSPGTSASSSTPTPLPTLSVPAKPTYTVQRGTIIDQVIFDGHIVPVKQQELYFKVGGRVRKTYVQEGDLVKAGELLADLEAADGMERQQALRELSVKRAQIRLNMAKMDLNLFKINANPYDASYESQMYLRSAQVDLAQLDLDETNMGLNDGTKSLSDAQIIAPFDGKLLSLGTSDGKEVEGYKPVAVIADVNTLEISADPSSDVTGKVTEKMAATVQPNDPSSTIKSFDAVIRRLPYNIGGTSTDAASSDKTIRISPSVAPQDAGYKLGDLVKVTVVLQRKENALWLPPSAIRNYEGRNFVLVKNGTVQERIDVRLGIIEVDKVEILDGVKEGMLVIAA